MTRRLFAVMLCGLLLLCGFFSLPQPAKATSLSAINGNPSLLALLHALYDTPEEGLSSADLEDILLHTDYRKNKTLDFSAAKVASLKKQGKLHASYRLDSLSGIEALASLKPAALKLSGQSGAMSQQAASFSGISGLSSLTQLEISSCGISSLNGLNLPNLKRLYAKSNSIQDASVLSGMRSLSYLDISGNQLAAIPNVPGLTVLIASNNPISSFSALAGMRGLNELELNHTRFDQNDFGHLKGLGQLQRLDVGYCEIDSLLPLSRLISSGNLKSLRNLKVEYNYLYFERQGGDSPETMGNVSILVNGALPAQNPRRVTNTPQPKPTPTYRPIDTPVPSDGQAVQNTPASSLGGMDANDPIFLEMWFLQQRILLESQAERSGAAGGNGGAGTSIFGIDPSGLEQENGIVQAGGTAFSPLAFGTAIGMRMVWWLIRYIMTLTK